MVYQKNGQFTPIADHFYSILKQDIEQRYKEMEEEGLSLEDCITLYHATVSFVNMDLLSIRFLNSKVAILEEYLDKSKKENSSEENSDK